MKDYYALLGLESKATKAEIKSNYRKLATKFHPDKNSATDSAAKFIAITEAYDVLSNRKRRAQYDLEIWEKLKRANEPDSSFRTVVPPRESSRTRRNKAQQKRSIKYHVESSHIKKLWSLVVESLLITIRYIPHLIGITLAIVIINSAIGQLSDTFEAGIGRGVGICLFIGGLVYCIYKIIQHAIEELKKDIEAYSVFYKIPQGKLVSLTLSVFVIILILLVTIIKVF